MNKRLKPPQQKMSPAQILKVVEAVDHLSSSGNPLAKVLSARLAGKPVMEQSQQIGSFYTWAFQLLTIMGMGLNSELSPDDFKASLEKTVIIPQKKP